MASPYEQIKGLLDGTDYDEFEHDPVYTIDQAAEVRDGLTAQDGAKSLLLKGENGFMLLVLRGDSRLDNKAVKAMNGGKGARFATPEEVLEIMGCEIGACYPFGSITDVPMFVDELLAQNERVAFNPGRHNRTIVMSWIDYEKVTQPTIGSFSKSEN